jgi:uncharacterized protein DUF3738
VTFTGHTALSALVLLLWPPGLGQAQPPQTFEVVSVKRSHAADDRTASMVQPGGRYRATNVTLRMLVKTAYGVHDDQVVGGPDWIASERFDVLAKAEGNPPTSVFRDQARLMLRQALADRFKLALRRERRASGFSRSAHVGARALDFSTLVTSLATWTDRVVVDRSGLTGRFDWDLQWTPDQLSPDAARPPDLSLFTALREQLGLKLESQRGMVEVLVVERAERPQPD